MSGHSKWNNIKNKKEKSDSQRAKIFTKIGREIAVAVKAGGPDPANNAKLKDVIAKAKSLNVPNDNIDRSIKKAAGDGDGSNYESITYEGYGPSGVAVIVETLTDNRNRTAADIRHIFSKHGGNLGETGCVGWMFKKRAVFVVEKETFDDEDALMELVLEAGAEDLKNEDDVFEIVAEPEAFDDIEKALGEKGIETVSAEVTMVPDNTVKVEGDAAVKMQKMLDALEENDDVQEVYGNYEMDEEE